MSETTMRAAIQAWVVATSGLATGKVFWAGQTIGKPAKPYIEMRLSAERGMGQDWTDSEDAPSPVDGADLLFLARGPRKADLRLQCYSDTVINPSAASYLASVRARSELPEMMDGINTEKVSVLSFGPINSTDGVFNTTVLEPRAIMDVSLSMVSEVSATGTWIESAEVSFTVT